MQRSDQSDEDYYKSLGCKYREDGTPEQPEQFWKRMGGIMYLYASIMITKQRQGVNKPHPHGIGNAWRWLAATLNIGKNLLFYYTLFFKELKHGFYIIFKFNNKIFRFCTYDDFYFQYIEIILSNKVVSAEQ